ncbi:MAG: hypothetical protein V4488_26640 [Pseudomonadota bacterium]
MKLKSLLPNSGRMMLIWLALIMFISYAAWWYDSIVTCDTEEGYTVHGACLNILLEKANAGSAGAMDILATHYDGTEEGDMWYRRAAMTGDVYILGGGILAACGRKTKGFSPAEVEGWMKAAYAKDPGAAFLLADLYIDFDKCGTRNLQLAVHYLPLMKQCQSGTIRHFVRIAIEDNFYVDASLKQLLIKQVEACYGSNVYLNRDYGYLTQEIRSLP